MNQFEKPADKIEKTAHHPDPLGSHVMDAKQLHSIYVPQGTEAAWLVIEGREDETYESVCYTTNPVFDSTGMYRPITNPFSVAVILKQTAEKYLRTQGINPEYWP